MACKKLCPGDFLLDDSSWLGRPVEVDSEQIETLAESSQHYTAWGGRHAQGVQAQHWERCTSLPVLITLMFGFHTREAEKTFLTFSSHAVLYWNVAKDVLFLKQTVTSGEKILYNSEQKRFGGKWNEQPPATPEKVMCVWRGWKGVLCCGSIWKTKGLFPTSTPPD